MNDPNSSRLAGTDIETLETSETQTGQPQTIEILKDDINQAPSKGSDRDSWLTKILPKRRNGATIRDDLEDALAGDEASSAGFSAEEKTMLTNILDLQELRVEDLMVPRADITAVECDVSLGELLRVFEESAHSRMPVYKDTLDDPRGMVHIRDAVAHITRSANLSKAEQAKRKNSPPANLDLKKVSLSKSLECLKLIRPVLFVPPSMMALDLMARMQAERIHVALVIDEYGGTDGLVSMEDIMEVIVGDIEDEHDTDDDEIIKDKGDGVYVCSAKAELKDIETELGLSFNAGDIVEDVDTIGGLVFTLAGRVPVRGEVIDGLGFEFRITDADPRRVKLIEFSRAKRKRGRNPAIN